MASDPILNRWPRNIAPGLNFDGVWVSDVTPDQILEAIREHILQKQKFTISQLGANTATIMKRDPELRQSLKTMSVICPDGVALLLASKWLGHPLAERVTGDILAPGLFQMAIREGFKLFFLGGEPGVAEKAATRLRRAYPGLEIAGTCHGYLAPDETPRVVAAINASKADIVLVGMGVPLQEKWIAGHVDQIIAPVLITVGGYFDHVLHRLDCYPTWVSRYKLNWLYRLCREPRRLWRRYLLGGLEFAFLVARLKWSPSSANGRKGIPTAE